MPDTPALVDPVIRPAPGGASPAAAPAAEPAAAARLAHLFRLSLRQGRVHPLQRLIQRYRAGDRA